MAGEFDLIGKHPEAALTVRSVDAFQSTMETLRSTIGPELELIESRITGPTKEFQSVLKLIRKSITKRDHKVRWHISDRGDFLVDRLLMSALCIVGGL
jgi:amphiphysin